MPAVVLPRAAAARVITDALARAAWVVSAANLLLTIPLLVEFAVGAGRAAAVTGPVAIAVALAALAAIGATRPRRLVAVAFLMLGAIGTVAYQIALITEFPRIVESSYFLVNRPAVSLVLVGVVSVGWVRGTAWSVLGFCVAAGTSAAIALLTGTPFRMGWGPLLVLAIYLMAVATLSAVQVRQRRRLPDFDALDRETSRLEAEENLRARLVAVVHDTLLNDLALVMNAPDVLDSRVTDRLRSDLATLTSAEWRTESSAIVVDDQDSELRNRVMLLISEFQWRGLTVHVTGTGTGIYRLPSGADSALVDAIRATLENVLHHSGSAVAELDLAYSDTDITVMITDQGTGFDRNAIDADRLGIRVSVVERMRAVGGSAKVWSTPGAGTSVIMRVPVAERVTAHEREHYGHQ